MKINKNTLSLILSRTKESNGCLIWQGTKKDSGYGTIKINQIIYRVHRLVYFLSFGSIPKGIYVCHRCDRPECVNPDHLFLGTQKENINDCRKKGRMSVGEHRPSSKLKEADVIYIFTNKTEAKRFIARKFKITPKAVRDIKNGVTWQYLTSAIPAEKGEG